MKLLAALFTLTLAAPLWAAPANVAYGTHDGYFVSNKFEPKELASFVVLADQKAFDGVFGAGFVMGDKAHRLPKDAFAKNIVVAAIHRGKALVTYKVESVTAENNTLRVRYSTKREPNATAEFSCPLILSVAKGDYGAVQFTEDGKDVKKIEMVSFSVLCKSPLASSAAKNEGRL